jgi:hypothetical protein
MNTASQHTVHAGDIVTDDTREWSDGPENAVVVGMEENGTRFELTWSDGMRSFERPETLDSAGWSVTCTHH